MTPMHEIDVRGGYYRGGRSARGTTRALALVVGSMASFAEPAAAVVKAAR